MDTLVQIWNTYKGDVIPALVSALIAFLPFFVFWIKSRLTLSNKKQEAQLDVLKQIADKEDTTPQLETLTNEIIELKGVIKDLKESVCNEAILFNCAFQGADLSPEIKSNLESLKNKVLIGNNQDLISELELRLSEVTEKYETLLKENEAKIAQVVEAVKPAGEKIKKIRR